ncbi:guanine deaminase [Rubrimonas cliftonensis]|uniref:Guanine deaminase n=1 Tax=Rubrimonas cliftonensis TaxID=89524 RepID=A0A1H3YW22_9RHOB|nr:guanine deaminase [Rubrimonas cliftonensis]SEA15391.1 guanine deaminase [Rubrimonas cliftonensis]
MSAAARLLRGTVVSFRPGEDPAPDVREDGAVVLRDGLIEAVGDWAEIGPRAAAAGLPSDDWRGKLILPGFVDPHIHFPQAQATAVHAEALLDWLARGAFPEEARFADPEHGRAIAPRFFDALIAHGTTTACAFCTSHPASVEAFFAEALRREMRMLGGKVLMDRGAPDALLDTPERAHDETEALIARWRGRGRLGYAVAPRFALTSTPAQLEVAGALVAAHPDCLVQTHLSENRAEIAEAARLFPEARDYTDVYARFGLLGPRSLMGHCIHLSDREAAAMAEAGAVAVWCPTSNLFLGSGLFDRARLSAAGVRVAVATDIGGGTAWGLPSTLGAAHSVTQLLGQRLHPFEAFRLATLGGAEALGLADRIGRVAPGFEADLVVLDPAATPQARLRAERAETLADRLFLVSTLGDDRTVAETYVAGAPRKRRAAA